MSFTPVSQTVAINGTSFQRESALATMGLRSGEAVEVQPNNHPTLAHHRRSVQPLTLQQRAPTILTTRATDLLFSAACWAISMTTDACNAARCGLLWIKRLSR